MKPADWLIWRHSLYILIVMLVIPDGVRVLSCCVCVFQLDLRVHIMVRCYSEVQRWWFKFMSDPVSELPVGAAQSHHHHNNNNV